MTPLPLQRAGSDVTSFLSALGGLRETRLTATLGYLIARFPEEFGPLLGHRPATTDRVSVEETETGDRYDVLIRSTGAVRIIEGKLGPGQRTDQLLRYVRSVRAQTRQRPDLTIVDDGSEFRQSRLRAFEPIQRQCRSPIRWVTWSDVARTCLTLAARRRLERADPTGVVIARELASHLQEHNMTHELQPEIYLRDVSDIHSVRLYFKHRIYKCQSKYYKSAHRNLYFAPYFTRSMAQRISGENLVPVGEGISFVSRVEAVQVVERRDLLRHLKERRHPEPEEAADVIGRGIRGGAILLMSLGEPRHLFVSPVTKAKLGFGQGLMGSRSCTLDRLLAAAQG